MKRLLVASILVGGMLLAGSRPSTSSPLTPAPRSSSVALPDPFDLLDVSLRQDDFDPTGAYAVLGRLPKQLGRIQYINLATVDDNGERAPLNGFVRVAPYSAPDYKMTEVKLEGTHLTFTTAAVKGISYTFNGTFERTGNFSSDPPPNDLAVLVGTLTKLKNGKRVIEKVVSLAYEMGD